mmetsp:Transcript_2229/g.2345  ORF Transcript_2229/g.2345 Transcript_2229/m.2345 type:complete len:248 (+) Transcript_2229:30-773(+)
MLLILITVLNFVIANSLKVTMFNSDLIKKSNNEEKELIIIRHGRTEMNEQLSIQEWGSDNFVDKRLFDTKLTVTGVRQAQKVNQEIISKSLGEIDLLISSPLSRTLQTAELVFKDIPVNTNLVLPLARERLYLSSDQGIKKSELLLNFPDWNYSNIINDTPWWYTPKDSLYKEWRPPGDYACPGEPEDVFRARMIALREWIAERPEKVIVLVTHWGVARALTGQSLNNCEVQRFPFPSLLKEPFIDP